MSKGMNIGLDLGSANSIVSYYREDMGVLQTVVDTNNSDVIPSVVALNGKNVLIGELAKQLTGQPGAKSLKAFKMLLMENKQGLIKTRGYDDKYTPKWATEEYLKQLLKKAQRQYRNGSVSIDNLVVGAPDVWFHSFETLSGRATVRDICKSIPEVGKVRIVSEPVLASAFFAYNFKALRKNPFEGSILIIDYGGGTLDLSLTEVKSIDGDRSEIKMLESNGAGENTEHCVGNAGIVYMESLMEYVIRKNNPSEADNIINTPEFFAAVNRLEMFLIAQSSQIEAGFENSALTFRDLQHPTEDDLEELEDDDNDPGIYISCNGRLYKVTLADIVVVYNDVIRPVFDKKMDEMIKWAKKERDIDVFKLQGDKFKIALVGGFGNFYLVREQMKYKFKLKPKGADDRQTGIITNERDWERAISYGAALIASGKYEICSTAPYSIGINLKTKDTKQVHYMVHYLEEIDLNKPYYIKREKDGENKIFNLGNNWADEFIIDYGRTNPEKIPFRAKDEFKKRLVGILEGPLKACCMGISFNDSDILSLHIREAFRERGKYSRFVDREPIELGKFQDVFEKIADDNE